MRSTLSDNETFFDKGGTLEDGGDIKTHRQGNFSQLE